MVKLPSISYLASQAKHSFLRFPFTIISSAIAVVIGIYAFEYKREIDNIFPFVNLILSFALGIPLYFLVAVFISKKQYNTGVKALLYFFTTLFLTLIWYTLPDSESAFTTNVPYVRYTVFNLIAHLVVSFIPYLGKGKLNGFWNYNKVLFLRFWASILYSTFLYIGLILALSSLDLLFDIDVHEELYFHLFIGIYGIFNTWFFVSGIPKKLDELDEVTTYPKGLKIFAQYVLLPLLILYLFILYVYGGKILIISDWPKGIVAYLISGVSTLGILTLLLIHPYSKQAENSWINRFTSIYYYLLFPLIVFLFVAIFIRIQDYGVTINRYILVLLGIWLSILAVFFSLKKTNIKFVPISLAVILSLMSFGPWGMFSYSKRSQTNRLIEILKDGEIIKNGKIENEVKWIVDSFPRFEAKEVDVNSKLISDSLKREVKSILDYLSENHNLKQLQPYFEQNIDSLIRVARDSVRYVNPAEVYMESMGIEYKHYSLNKDDRISYYDFSLPYQSVTEVKGYDYLTSFSYISYHNKENNKLIKKFTVADTVYRLGFKEMNENQLILYNDSDTAFFRIDELREKLIKKYGTSFNEQVEEEDITLLKSTESFNVKIRIKGMNLSEEEEGLVLIRLNGNILLTQKQ